MPGDKRIYLVSAPYPSGVTWLFNALLELGIKTTGSAIPCSWHKTFKGYTLNKDAREQYQKSTPACRLHEFFQFQPGLQVESDHRLSCARHPDCKAILFVRDGRDSAYSHYRRHPLSDTMCLLDSLRRPENYEKSWLGPQNGLRALFNLPVPDLWAYFNLFWLAMREVMPVLVVRFEDSRAQPEATLKEVLDFIGVSRTAADIASAAERSSYQAAKAVAAQIAAEKGNDSLRQVRKGKIGEWREVMSALELACFSGPAALALSKFGYDSEMIPPAPHGLPESSVSPDVGAALAHFEAGQFPDAERRLWQALPAAAANHTAFVQIAAAVTALRWVRTIFSDSRAHSPAGKRAFAEFMKLNAAFSGCWGVQYALASNVRYFPAELLAPDMPLDGYARGRASTHHARTREGTDVIPDDPFFRLPPGPETIGSYSEIIGQLDQHLAQGRPTDCGRLVAEALKVYPYTADLHRRQAAILLQLQCAREAVLAFERATFLDPYPPEPHLKEAQLFWAGGQRERALAILEDLLTYVPDCLPAIRQISDWLYEMERRQRCVEYLYSEVELSPDDAGALLKLALVLIELDQRDEAQSALQEAVTKSAGDEAILANADKLLQLLQRGGK